MDIILCNLWAPVFPFAAEIYAKILNCEFVSSVDAWRCSIKDSVSLHEFMCGYYSLDMPLDPARMAHRRRNIQKKSSLLENYEKSIIVFFVTPNDKNPNSTKRITCASKPIPQFDIDGSYARKSFEDVKLEIRRTYVRHIDIDFLKMMPEDNSKREELLNVRHTIGYNVIHSFSKGADQDDIINFLEENCYIDKDIIKNNFGAFSE